LKYLCAWKIGLMLDLNMYDSSKYVTSNSRSLRYDSDNVSQDDNEDED
jgi:hypothetical protein